MSASSGSEPLSGSDDVISRLHFLFGRQQVVDLSLSLGVMMWSLASLPVWVSACSRSESLSGGDDVVSDITSCLSVSM